MSDEAILSSVRESDSKALVSATWSEANEFHFPAISLWFQEDAYMDTSKALEEAARAHVREGSPEELNRRVDALCAQHSIPLNHRDEVRDEILALAQSAAKHGERNTAGDDA